MIWLTAPTTLTALLLRFVHANKNNCCYICGKYSAMLEHKVFCTIDILAETIIRWIIFLLHRHCSRRRSLGRHRGVVITQWYYFYSRGVLLEPAVSSAYAATPLAEAIRGSSSIRTKSSFSHPSLFVLILTKRIAEATKRTNERIATK